MALCLLAADWAAARAAALTALIVDHGLRPDSAAEARKVGRWLRGRGIRHAILRWQGPRPAGDIQAAARVARYDLLTGWCRARGVLHLLLAHHRDDQAETLLLRLARGSGLDGLAGMPAVAERDGVRLLRPLLGVAGDRLRATLTMCGQAWVEDPSNRNTAFARVRLRALLPALAAEGLTAERLAATAGRLGAARAALEVSVAALLAEAAVLHPAGYVRLALPALAAAPPEIGRRALARCLMTVGGETYTPRFERLDRLYALLARGTAWPARTLAGCRILRDGADALICREPAQAGPAAPAMAGARVVWDGRFMVDLAAVRRGVPRGAVIAALGPEGWRQAMATRPDLRGHALPAPVRPSLPALWQSERLLAVPHLGWSRGQPRAAAILSVAFVPRHPLAAGDFSVA